MMKTAKLIHNPGAGEGGYPSKETLIDLIESAGFNCSYLSVKEDGWLNEEFGEADFLVAAGGDGTVKKVVNLMLEKGLLSKGIPLGLLPVGTANNIASALGILGKQKDIVRSWNAKATRNYDISRITGLNGDKFFIEGFGFGLFPYMVKKLKEKKTENGYPEDKITLSLKTLLEIIPDYPAKRYQMVIDEKEYEGDFLMVGVHNIPSIGPNLKLAPTADPGDGSFDLVLVSEDQRDSFAEYVSDRIEGKKGVAFLTSFKARKIEIRTADRLIHVDDEIMDLEQDVHIKSEVMEKPLVFFK